MLLFTEDSMISQSHTPFRFLTGWRGKFTLSLLLLIGLIFIARPSLSYSKQLLAATVTPSQKPSPAAVSATFTPASKITPTPIPNDSQAMQEIAQKLFERKAIRTAQGSFYTLPDNEQQIAKRGYFIWQASGYSPRNFILRAHASWDSASRNADWNMSGVGFIFRERNNAAYYGAFLLLNGYVDIFRVNDQNSSFKRLAHKRYGKLELPQGNASLMLVVDEPQILFFVNEKLVAQVKDEALSSEDFRAGRLNFALASGTNKDYGLRVRMEQIGCWTIGDEKLPTPSPTSVSLTPRPTLDALTAQGIQTFQFGDYAKAVTMLNQAIESNLHYLYAEGYFYRARAQSELGNYQAALNDFALAIQIAPADASLYLYRGYTYQKMDQFDKALSDFTKAIQLNSDEVWAYRARAALFTQQGNYTKALEDYQQVLQRVTDRAIDYNNRCWLYTQLKEYQKALEDCNDALSLSPKEKEFLDTRAALYLAMGEKEKAKADLEAILQLNPDQAMRSRVQEALKQLK